MSMDDPSPKVAEPPLFDSEHILQLLGVSRGQAVGVAGAGSLEIMVSLCREGWERVECALQATCAGADETSDLLILTGPPESLGALTARTVKLLKDGGTLVAALGRPEDDMSIRAALLAKGMTILQTTLDIGGARVVAHRVARAARAAPLARTA
jgi:hypothetical protein